MDTYFTDLSPTAQTAYAQILDDVTASTLYRSVADLTGSFASKTVAGKEYWYFQYRDIDAKLKQVYLGPRGPRLDQLIALKQSGEPLAKTAIARQARAAVSLGNAAIIRPQFRVIKRLEEYGFFKAGGVLIGTHAFACFGNMMGVSWRDANKTQDVDFAYSGRSVSLALPSDIKIDVHDAISSLEMGFLPSSKLSGMTGGSYVIPSQPDFRLDFITTVGREDVDLVNFPNLNVAMTPLKFIEYSLRDVRQAAMLSDDGAFLVNIPDPARYALHKLIVAGERGGSFQTKVAKDLRQSASLLTFFSQHRTADIVDAWIDLEGRGKGWRSRFDKGLGMLLAEEPAIASSVDSIRQEVLLERERLGQDHGREMSL